MRRSPRGSTAGWEDGKITAAGTVVSSSDARGVASKYQGSDLAKTRPDSVESAVQDDLVARQFADALDLSTWTSGDRLAELSARLEHEVEAATQHESEMGPRVLALLREHLRSAPDASVQSGVYDLEPHHVSDACKNVLFNGQVEACDGTRVIVPTLPVTVVQIGICLTSYVGTGDGGSIVQRLFRHDITRRTSDAEGQVRDFISQRARRRKRRPGEEFGDDGRPLPLSDLLCRALMTYGERAMLADRSDKPWRLGHGSPMPYEMLIGSGREEMIWASLAVLRRLLVEHKRFVFVPSEISDQAIRTIANALRPLQYAVLRNTKDIVDGYVTGSSYERPFYKQRGIYDALQAFRDDVGGKVLLGVYRVSRFSPGGVFFAHEDHVHEAAQIAIADSALQEHRGFPNLIDIADRTCRGIFDARGVATQVHTVLARTGAPFRYFDERSTRR